MNSLYEIFFKHARAFVCTVKWFQALLFNTRIHPSIMMVEFYLKCVYHKMNEKQKNCKIFFNIN